MVNTPLLYKFLKAFGPQSPSLRVLQDIEPCPTESLDLDILISDAQGLDLATFKVPTSFKSLLESFTYYMASCPCSTVQLSSLPLTRLWIPCNIVSLQICGYGMKSDHHFLTECMVRLRET